MHGIFSRNKAFAWTRTKVTSCATLGHPYQLHFGSDHLITRPFNGRKVECPLVSKNPTFVNHILSSEVVAPRTAGISALVRAMADTCISNYAVTGSRPQRLVTVNWNGRAAKQNTIVCLTKEFTPARLARHSAHRRSENGTQEMAALRVNVTKRLGIRIVSMP
jgi:hypothetical protein